MPSMQVAPFSHGLGSQSSISENWSKQDKDSINWVLRVCVIQKRIGISLLLDSKHVRYFPIHELYRYKTFCRTVKQRLKQDLFHAETCTMTKKVKDLRKSAFIKKIKNKNLTKGQTLVLQHWKLYLRQCYQETEENM